MNQLVSSVPTEGEVLDGEASPKIGHNSKSEMKVKTVIIVARL